MAIKDRQRGRKKQTDRCGHKRQTEGQKETDRQTDVAIKCIHTSDHESLCDPNPSVKDTKSKIMSVGVGVTGAHSHLVSF